MKNSVKNSVDGRIKYSKLEESSEGSNENTRCNVIRSLILVFIGINVMLLLVCFWDSDFTNTNYFNSRVLWRNISFKTKKLEDPFKECIFPDFNPYDKEIKEYVNLWRNDETKCPKIEVYTKFENKTISSLGEDKFCFGRCITRKDDWTNSYGNWTSANNTQFECDFVEAGCTSENDISKMDFNKTDVHMQVNRPNYLKNSSNDMYNVIVLAFDSHATTQIYRNMPKSLTFMTKGLDAVMFPYVNKVGENTRPNMIPFLYGKSIEPLDKMIYGMGKQKEDWSWSGSCRRYMDNETDLIKEFKTAGYTLMTADDWEIHMLGWPNCLGVKEQIPQHTFQPYIRELVKGNYSKSHKGATCASRDTQAVYRYTQKFLDAYPDKSKFMFVVSTAIGHGSEGGSVQFDTHLYSFLWNNKEILDKSFVFMLGDHGFRLGGASNTKIGKFDNNNPMLIISVPKELRKNGILDIMKENAGKLQTHYDTRATLLDILKYQPSANFTARESFQIPGEKGNSYLRKQLGERSCRNLPIPFQYCICQYEMESLDPKSNESIVIGKAVISHINELLKTRNVTNDCLEWTFGKVVEISAYAPKDVTNAFKVQIGASKPYDKAVFITLVNRKGEDSFHVGSVDRADKYEKRGDCQKTDLQPLCHCKNQKN